MLLDLDKDTASHVWSYLGGNDRARLSQCSLALSKTTLLRYDGPRPTPNTLVLRLPDCFWPFAYRTANGFVYTCCTRPFVKNTQWLTDAALDPAVSVQVFLYAFLTVKTTDTDTDTDTDALLRYISEDLQSPTQQQKLVCVLCLTGRPDDVTREYVLKMACLSGCQNVVRYLVTQQHFDVTVGALTMVLVSQHYTPHTRVQMMEYLLVNAMDPDVTIHLNYWALKYALFLDEWDVFHLLYRHMYEHNVWTPQVDSELRHALPDGYTRDTLRTLLARTRASLH